MKAIVLRAPDEAVLQEVPEPPAVGEHDILLQVRRIGLCGSDLNSYRGRKWDPLESTCRHASLSIL